MKVTIKETRILTLEVRVKPGKTQEEVEKEIRSQLGTLPLDDAQGGPRELWKGGTRTQGSARATYEVVEEEPENSQILAVETDQ